MSRATSGSISSSMQAEAQRRGLIIAADDVLPFMVLPFVLAGAAARR
jgi:hypothetical protein